MCHVSGPSQFLYQIRKGDNALFRFFRFHSGRNFDQGGPQRPPDTISIESNEISNRSNRKSQKSSNGRKIARMARILMIFGRFESHRRQLQFPKISNERKIIESIESIDSIERSRDRSYRSEAAVDTAALQMSQALLSAGTSSPPV